MKKLTLTFLALMIVLGMALTGCGQANDDSSSSGEKGGESKSTATDAGKKVSEKVDYKIVGIDPGAGEMGMAKKALKKYDSLKGWTLQPGSGATMTAALDRAIQRKEPIIVTGWSPHWMFAKYDLKYLKDPKGVFGDSEKIHTLVHKGFKDKNPDAAKILDQFHWTKDDMNTVMLNGQKKGGSEKDVAAAAEEWVKNNPDKVAKWTKGVEKGSGKIKIAYVAWASAIASNNVIKTVLENQGYDVELVQLDAGAMWAALAKGEVNAIICGWLPVTHEAYYKKYKDQVTDLGSNLEGTKLGFVVPKYVDIDSIEDLQAK